MFVVMYEKIIGNVVMLIIEGSSCVLILGSTQNYSDGLRDFKLHGYTVHQTMLKPFYYQLMHIMLKNTVIKTF